MEPSTDPSAPLVAGAWRRWRSRFYFWLVVALMLTIAVAGWYNLRRLGVL